MLKFNCSYIKKNKKYQKFIKLITIFITYKKYNSFKTNYRKIICQKSNLQTILKNLSIKLTKTAFLILINYTYIRFKFYKYPYQKNFNQIYQYLKYYLTIICVKLKK